MGRCEIICKFDFYEELDVDAGWTEMGRKKWVESAFCAMGRIFTVSELGRMDLGRPWKMPSSRETTYWFRPKSIRPNSTSVNST